MDEWMNGYPDIRMCACARARACGRVGVWVCGYVDVCACTRARADAAHKPWPQVNHWLDHPHHAAKHLGVHLTDDR